jgi:hypothetical protein
VMVARVDRSTSADPCLATGSKSIGRNGEARQQMHPRRVDQRLTLSKRTNA